MLLKSKVNVYKKEKIKIVIKTYLSRWYKLNWHSIFVKNKKKVML